MYSAKAGSAFEVTNVNNLVAASAQGRLRSCDLINLQPSLWL